jgi:hypothetical protein
MLSGGLSVTKKNFSLHAYTANLQDNLDLTHRYGRYVTDERTLRQHRQLSRNTGGQAAVGQGREPSRDPRQNHHITYGFHTK